MKALIICKKCKKPYIDDVLESDNHTFCPNIACKAGVWLKEYLKCNIKNIKQLFY